MQTSFVLNFIKYASQTLGFFIPYKWYIQSGAATQIHESKLV